MDDFLTINDFAVPVADSVQQIDVVGDPTRRAIDGRALLGENRRRRRWTMRTPPLPLEDQEALRALLAGFGHYWSFDAVTLSRALFSSKGVREFDLDGAPAVTATSKFGANALELNVGESVSWNKFDINADLDVTFMVWVNTTEGGGYQHRIQTTGGVKYQDGVIDASPTIDGIFVITATGARLQYPTSGTADAAVEFDDLVILPFVITDAMALAFGTATQAFSELPRLRADGEFVTGDIGVVSPVTVESDPAGLDMPVINALGLRATVGFSLLEVQRETG